MLSHRHLEEMSFDDRHAFGVIHTILSIELQNTIEAKDGTKVADWKAQIGDMMLSTLDKDWIHRAWILNMAPYTRTIVYSFEPDHLHELRDHLTYHGLR